MSARYVQSLRYNVQQCDWLLNNIGYIVNAKGTPDLSQDEECNDPIDFLYDLKLGYEREIADVGADMARREGMVV